MDIKQYLNRAKRATEHINAKLDQSERLELYIKHINSTDSRGNFSPTKDKITKLKNEINNKIDYYIDVTNEIYNLIGIMEDDDCKLLLELKYLNFKTWEEIAEIMGYSDRWVRGGLHSKALMEAEKSRGN